MKTEVVMPKMGESIQEGKILRWLKKEGDRIERDETLLEISTDKVDTEVPSPTAGIVLKIMAQENDTIEVGNIIAIVGDESEAGNIGAAPIASAPAPAQQEAPAPVAASAPAPAPVQQETAPAPVQQEPTSQASAPAAGGALTEVVMPKMGESIQEGKILRWLKAVGDKIERDETLLEISTDKVDTEVPSPVAGTIAELLGAENDVIEVGKVIARISTGAATSAPTPQPSAPAPQAAPAPQPAAPTPQPAAATNGYANGHAAPAPQPVPAGGGTKDIPRSSGKRFYSPLVRTMAEAEGVTLEELENVQGSGIEGRVTKDDFKNYLQNRGSRPAAPAPQPVAAPQLAPQPAQQQSTPRPAATPASGAPSKNWGDAVEIIPMDRVRQLISAHMVMSKTTSPHVTSVAEADVTAIVKLREKKKAEFEKREGFKLTFTPFFAKAAVDGLKAFPMVNVSVDGTNIIRHKRINLSFATALDDGNLIVPVIKNAADLNVTGLGRAVSDLSTRARSKKLSPDDIQGGTFTITNVGSFGSLFGTPVINQPQTGIMGIGAIQKRPVVREIGGEDVIVVRHMVYLSITYDHRVIDGALATQCLAAICKSLENMNESNVGF
ncbi:MAG TPA: 2-oxoglutarate dehydrogenase, E2 component, dihydrolipoamide succinyltransferase [Patescibacteria group bacterium]|nr:2-oxoglutarate dehydrogenase, E2 component, dihydrolipoamide succinyltransferase [Patescibacteria group bacterium]